MARGQDHAKRAASGSDYLLTGLIRCPACGAALLGTRAHGKTKTYRYYSCYRRIDTIEQAVTGALAGFFRHQHNLIAVAATQAGHAADHESRHAELAATERELARADAAIDRSGSLRERHH